MIVSFKHKGLKRLFERGDRSHIGADLINKVENILATLDAASTPQALDLPGYRLHPLKGGRKGFWAVTIRANWRIIFRFENGDALDVELVDYPPHPGRIVRDECLQPLGLSVTAGAKVLGVSRQALNNLVNARAGISPEMAIRLAKAFGSTAQTWLRMQSNYDLAKALKSESKIRVRRYHRAEVAA